MQVELCEIPLAGGASFDMLRINSPEECGVHWMYAAMTCPVRLKTNGFLFLKRHNHYSPRKFDGTFKKIGIRRGTCKAIH
jgi:hypothetical protein